MFKLTSLSNYHTIVDTSTKWLSLPPLMHVLRLPLHFILASQEIVRGIDKNVMQDNKTLLPGRAFNQCSQDED